MVDSLSHYYDNDFKYVLASNAGVFVPPSTNTPSAFLAAILDDNNLKK